VGYIHRIDSTLMYHTIKLMLSELIWMLEYVVFLLEKYNLL